MGWKEYIDFERSVLSFAWAGIKSGFREWKRDLIFGSVAFVTSILVRLLIYGYRGAMQDNLISGILGTLVLGVSFCIWKLFAAPYRLWQLRQEIISNQEQQISGLIEGENQFFELLFDS